MKKQRTPSQIKKILESYGKSGLSKSDFSRQNGIPLTTFCSWVRKESKKSLKFIPVALEQIPLKKVSLENKKIENLRLNLPSGFSLEIPLAIDSSWLSDLLKELT